MFQKIQLVGYLGADPVMRFTRNGDAVTHFSVAVNRKYQNQRGQTVEEVMWFRVTTWRRIAEVCAQYLHEGALVMVNGRMTHSEPWQDRNGNWRHTLEIEAEPGIGGVVFLKTDPEKQNSAVVEGNAPQQQPSRNGQRATVRTVNGNGRQPAYTNNEADVPYEENIPFG